MIVTDLILSLKLLSFSNVFVRKVARGHTKAKFLLLLLLFITFIIRYFLGLFRSKMLPKFRNILDPSSRAS